ncbi:hypothetical protein JTB14_014912 [Gonioctena quinquepunctata]|nr:hypothetical protein JTB14_014912 [Gonioctena quinquepunctata]
MNKRSPSPNSSGEINVNIELDIKALRGKNKQLIQAVAKLQQEKSIQQTQITALHEEFFKLNSKYVNLKNIFSTIDATTKICFPKQLELVNAFGKIMQLCSIGATVSNVSKDPKTQTVKPHNVNGHVLQNPTITLSRFNDSDSMTPPRISSERNSPNRAENEYQTSPLRGSDNVNSSRNTRASTSRMHADSSANDARLSNQENDFNNMLDDMVLSRRSILNLDRLTVLNNDDDDSMDTPGEEEEEETNNDDYCDRLVTIREEEEEQYNPTLRSLNASQTAFSDRVREIRIFLDPLPKDCIDQQEDTEHFVNRTSSLTGEPSTSVLDANSTLLNETVVSSNRTMKLISSMRESQSFSFKNSPSQRKSGYFEEMNSSSSRQEESDVNEVQRMRGQYNKSRDSSQKFNHESKSSRSDDSSIIMPVKVGQGHSFSQSISAISENTFNGSASVDMENSKLCTMKSLGLEPTNSRLTTSTPMVRSPRTSSRNKKLNISRDSITMQSPVDSKVTKRRGGSDEKKFAQVLLKRLSLEKRLSSGSPIKKISLLLNTSPITKSSDIKRSKRSINQETQDVVNNTSVSSSEVESTPETSKKKKYKISKKIVKGKTKGKENRQATTPIQQTRSSPRPRRAAKPKSLKEPSLGKKMRRSR